MTAHHLQQLISDKIKNTTEEITSEFPETQEWLENYDQIHHPTQVVKNSVVVQADNLLSNHTSANSHYIQQVTAEELQTVLFKLQQFMDSSEIQAQTDNLLYLEQQLSDLLGFSVTSTLDGHQLPHQKGVLWAGQHLKRYPLDSIDQHSSVQAADIASKRPFFGWMSPQKTIPPDVEKNEQYWVALALSSLPEWISNIQLAKHWWLYRKILIVNPRAATFTVSTVADTMVSGLKHQFLGSPELVTSTKCWAPGLAGRVAAFFIDDQQNAVQLGPIRVTLDM